VSSTIVDVPLQGPHEGIDPRVLPAGVLKAARNVRYTDDGAIRKRLGFERAAPTALHGTTPTTADAISLMGDERIWIGDDTINARSSVSGALTPCGRVNKWALERVVVGGRTDTDLVVDVHAVKAESTGGAAVCVVWRTSGSDVYAVIVDRNTGTQLYPVTQISSGYTASVMQAAYDSNADRPVVFMRISGDIRATAWTYGAGWATLTTVVSDATGDLDLVITSGGLPLLVYVRTGDVRVVKCNSSFASVATYDLAAATYTRVAIATDSTRIWIFAHDGANGVRGWETDTSLTPLFAAAAVHALSTGNLYSLSACVYDATTAIVAWSLDDGTLDLGPFRWATIDTAAAVTLAFPRYHLHSISRPVVTDGEAYILIRSSFMTQRASLFVLRMDLANIGTNAPGPAGEVFIEAVTAGSTSRRSPLESLGSGRFLVGYPTRIAATGTVSGNYGANAAVFRDSGPRMWRTAEAGSLSLVVGGTPCTYDGDMALEAAFDYDPPIVDADAAEATTGGSLGNAVYQFACVYERIDARGNLLRSAPSPLVESDHSGSGTGTNKTTLTIPTLSTTRATNTAPVVIAVYRSLADGSVLYRDGIVASNAFNENATYVSTAADATIADNEVLPTTGGVLENAPLPSPNIMVEHQGGFAYVDPRDPTRIGFTFEKRSGFALEHNEIRQARVDGCREVTGLASRDGKLIAFGSESIHIIEGQGATRAATGSFFPSRKLPVSDGCIAQDSIVMAGPGGDIFFQSKRGLCRLPRGEPGVDFIGHAVRDTLATYPDVVDAVAVPADSLVVWSVVDDLDTPTAGRLLVYDYRANQWSVDSIRTTAIVPGRLAVWNDKLAVIDQTTGYVYVQKTTSDAYPYADTNGASNNFVTMYVETGDINPAGLDRYLRFRTVSVLGRLLGECSLTLQTAYNGEASFTESKQWDIDTGGDRSLGQGTADASIRREYAPPYSRLDSVRFAISDLQNSGVSSAGVSLTALALRVTAQPRHGWVAPAEAG